MNLDLLLDGCTLKLADDRESALPKTICSVRQSVVVMYSVQKQLIADGGEVSVDIREGDVVSNIQANVPFKLLVGPHMCEPTNRLVLLNCPYTVTKIQFFVEPNTIVQWSYSVSLLSLVLRSQVRNTRVLLCDDLMYKAGVASLKKKRQ
jgi:hypothetical protein